MHRIAASGLVLLVTLTSGTYAQKVDVIPETSCPDIQPAYGASCSPLSVNETCTYGEVCCPDDGGACAPETTCYCDGGSSNWNCYGGGGETIPCPSMCPETPPDAFDTCDIDSRFSCVYGDTVVCDELGWENKHEKECFCTYGHFYCSSNVCPVACPATQPVEGEACTDFMDYYCSYDEFCCPGDDSSDVCVPKTQCYCNTNMTITCYEPLIVCPSVCPVSNPIESDSSLCTIDERYLCKYENGTCESPYEVGETTCTCSSGNYECTQTCMIFDYEYEDVAMDAGAPGDTDPLLQNPLGTVEEEDVEQRNTTLDNAKRHHPSNGKETKEKKKKHAKKKRGQEKKEGKTRTLLRRQLERPDGKFPFPE